MMLTLGMVRADLIAARQAIAYYEEQGVKDIKNIAAYHLQQAAEKAIKYQVYRSGMPYEDRSMYTHNLEKLILYAETKQISVIIPEYIRTHSLILTDWEAGSRYDVAFSIRIDALKRCFTVIEAWIDQLS